MLEPCPSPGSLLVADSLGEALAPVWASVLWHGEERATVTVTDGPACRGSASDEKINGSIGSFLANGRMGLNPTFRLCD